MDIGRIFPLAVGAAPGRRTEGNRLGDAIVAVVFRAESCCYVRRDREAQGGRVHAGGQKHFPQSTAEELHSPLLRSHLQLTPS